jgi:hypothetical protein
VLLRPETSDHDNQEDERVTTMRTPITALITLTAAFTLGCDGSEDFEELDDAQALDAQAPEDEAEFSVYPEGTIFARPDLDPEELARYGSIQAPLDAEQIAALGEITAPPSKGTCGGYWETSTYADFQGCGTCTHTIPEPDRDGNLAYWYRRWCWTGWGCSGCEPWVVVSTQCYDNCE